MSTIEGSRQRLGSYRVKLDHQPKSKKEQHRRVHYYVCHLGVAVADQLQEALINLRDCAKTFSLGEVKAVALKGYSDQEFVSAVKELLCIWMHQESVDQGGGSMPPWLLTFLRLGFGATDFMLPHPRAREVMIAYENCATTAQLCRQTALRACQALGFAAAGDLFVPYIEPLVSDCRSIRQDILEAALTLPIEVIESQAVPLALPVG